MPSLIYRFDFFFSKIFFDLIFYLIIVYNWQSSINSYGGLGTITLASGNVALLVSCLFVPTWMIKKLECKWTIVVCQLSFSFFVLAQFYPAFYTLIPASVIVGFGAAPMVNIFFI